MEESELSTNSHRQKGEEAKITSFEQQEKMISLANFKENPHHTLQGSNLGPTSLSQWLSQQPIDTPDYSLNVSLDNNSNTKKIRFPEYVRDERWWHPAIGPNFLNYGGEGRPPRLIEREEKERQWRIIQREKENGRQHKSIPDGARLVARLFVLEKSFDQLFMDSKERERQRLIEHKEQQRKKSELFAAVANCISGLSVSTEVKRTEDFSSGEKEFYVAGSVNGTIVEALPDTGAEASFISPHLASRLGLHPIPGPQKRITLGNNKTVKSTGMVTVPWNFSKERITHMIKCWILPGCTSDLVLGNDFLKATNALKKVCYRIKSKLFGVPKRLSLSYLGNRKRRLRGYLNGHSTAALADTGSDAMFINGAYARSIGLNIDSDVENQVQVRLADGSTIMTSGMARNIYWEVGKMVVQCNFYVLENLCMDVILSKNYLFEKNIFSEQEEHFIDINSEDDSKDDHDDGYEDYMPHFCILSIDTTVHGKYAFHRFKRLIYLFTDLSQRQHLNPTGTERTRKARRAIQTR